MKCELRAPQSCYQEAEPQHHETSSVKQSFRSTLIYIQMRQVAHLNIYAQCVTWLPHRGAEFRLYVRKSVSFVRVRVHPPSRAPKSCGKAIRHTCRSRRAGCSGGARGRCMRVWWLARVCRLRRPLRGGAAAADVRITGKEVVRSTECGLLCHVATVGAAVHGN